jgi:X-Pro dipeptidyl-peptidase
MKPGRLVRLAVAAAATFLVVIAAPGVAKAQTSPVITDGVTSPVFGYSDAIRERLWITADFDSDLNGIADEIALDIIRPAAGATGLKSPVIMDASPYFTTLCRGNEGECIADVDGDGLNDRWPLYYDNYFVPRGYAIMLLHMVGTGFSTGCPVTGGTPDNRSAVLAIDWLNGRRTAHDAGGNTVVADWDNGKSGMIGKSYDGTLGNAAAAAGVDGLTTIVPISAISTWYNYTRQAGLGLSGWASNYPSSLSNTVTNPDRRAGCAAVRTTLNATDGDENYDFTPFWLERDYFKDIDNVDASVFVAHGIQDDNVKANQFSEWWYELAERDVPRKLWLGRVGHEDPFDFRRDVWVNTLHRWFDHWLFEVPNGIMSEPMVTVEREGGDVFEDYADWPTSFTSGRRRPGPAGCR